VRIGNDTDTVAAIAGGLLGARWGASAIPAKWKTIRTPTVAAAYLARRLEISGAEALARVRAVLPQAHPNPGFVTALNRLWPEEGA
jgi:hypothetical protein